MMLEIFYLVIDNQILIIFPFNYLVWNAKHMNIIRAYTIIHAMENYFNAMQLILSYVVHSGQPWMKTPLEKIQAFIPTHEFEKEQIR